MPQDFAPIGPLFVTDDDVRRLDSTWAVGVMTEVVRAHAEGLLVAPARVGVDVSLLATAGRGDAVDAAVDDAGADEATSGTRGAAGAPSPGRIVMTAGRTREWFGYRVYDTLATSGGQQVVVAHDGVTGDVTAIAVGSALGAHRTGALGGLAMRALMPRDMSGAPRPVRLAVIGAGRQAWTQLWAAAGVLDVADVRVAARSRASASAFCERAGRDFGVACAPADSAREALRGADVAILATTSSTPVIEAASLAPDCVVVTLGPKQVGRAEFSLDLLDGGFVTTDSLEQLHAYDPPALASVHLPIDAVVALGDVLTGAVEPPASGRRVHLSVGLAGTEVALLAAMASSWMGSTAR